MFFKSKLNNHLRRRFQNLIAGIIFPSNQQDWFQKKGYGSDNKTPFDDFVSKQRLKDEHQAKYFHEFENLTLKQKHIPSKLSSGKKCELEVCEVSNDFTKVDKDGTPLPGHNKHIIYFPGAATYYQACFRDISAIAKETGATIHAFNFPGTGSSSGQVIEAKDLINSGISVVNNLLKKNPTLSIDDIILQGDCYGAAIAYEVKKQFEDQSQLKLRIVVNNAFRSFEAAIIDMLPWPLKFLSPLISKILKWTGWDIRPANMYEGICPDQIHIQHCGDLTLRTSTLAEDVDKKVEKRDPCPFAFRKDRDELSQKLFVEVKPECEERLKKFGLKNGKVNAHYADLCELQTTNQESVYTDLINDFIKRTDNYYQKRHVQHPRSTQDSNNLYHYPKYLLSDSPETMPFNDEDEMDEIENALQELADFRSIERERMELFKSAENEHPMSMAELSDETNLSERSANSI